MKIKTDSWHFKLYRRSYKIANTRRPERTNLCQYMRRLLLVLPLQALLFLGLIAGVIYIVVTPFVLVYQNLGWHGLVYLLGGMAALAGIIYGIYCYIEYGIYNPSENKEPNIFVQWIRAKKQKICPLIEFEE